jgi:hypothetical protein
MKNQLIVAVIGTAIVVGGGGFYLGMHYAAAKGVLSAQNSGVSMMNGGGRTRGMRGGMSDGFVSGDIVALDAQSMTIQLQSGAFGQGASTSATASGSRIVFLGDATQVVKTVEGETKDLTVGGQVTVTGTPNADGSVTAQSIQIRPTRSVSGR